MPEMGAAVWNGLWKDTNSNKKHKKLDLDKYKSRISPIRQIANAKLPKRFQYLFCLIFKEDQETRYWAQLVIRDNRIRKRAWNKTSKIPTPQKIPTYTMIRASCWRIDLVVLFPLILQLKKHRKKRMQQKKTHKARAWWMLWYRALIHYQVNSRTVTQVFSSLLLVMSFTGNQL